MNVGRRITDSYAAVAALGGVAVATFVLTTAFIAQWKIPETVRAQGFRLDTLEVRYSRKQFTDSLQFHQLNHKLCVLIPDTQKQIAGCPR
jgi:hypothetical protein